MKLVTIKKSPNVYDLIVLKTRLEAEGIKCFLRNELSAQIINFGTFSEVELQVPETDLERAMQIMKEVEKGENFTPR